VENYNISNQHHYDQKKKMDDIHLAKHPSLSPHSNIADIPHKHKGQQADPPPAAGDILLAQNIKPLPEAYTIENQQQCMQQRPYPKRNHLAPAHKPEGQHPCQIKNYHKCQRIGKECK
jgi:hypothetical protein